MSKPLPQSLLCLCVWANGPCEAISSSQSDLIRHWPGFCAPFETSVCINCRRLCFSPIPPSKRQGLLPSLHCNNCQKERRLFPRMSFLLPAWLVSFPSVTAAQSHLAAERLGCQRENLLKICRMERGLSCWQEPDYVTREVLCPAPGCFQTFPRGPKTRSCRLFLMPPKVGLQNPPVVAALPIHAARECLHLSVGKVLPGKARRPDRGKPFHRPQSEMSVVSYPPADKTDDPEYIYTHITKDISRRFTNTHTQLGSE